MKAYLQELFVTLKVVALEKTPFSKTQNPKIVNTLTGDDKHDPLNRENMAQPVQMQLSQK